MMELAAYVKIFATILAIVNPLGVIPIYVSLTRGSTEQERRHIARKTSITVAVILISAALAGKLFLNFFGISIASFRVGGGILLLLMSIHMMQARHTQSRQTPEEAEEAEEKESIAVVPIGMPLLAGPGAISTVIIYAHSSFQPLPVAAIIISILLVAILTWISLSIANPITKVMSKTAINIATRLMGLLLAAIAVEFIAGGIGQLFPVLTAYQENVGR